MLFANGVSMASLTGLSTLLLILLSYCLALEGQSGGQCERTVSLEPSAIFQPLFICFLSNEELAGCKWCCVCGPAEELCCIVIGAHSVIGCLLTIQQYACMGPYMLSNADGNDLTLRLILLSFCTAARCRMSCLWWRLCVYRMCRFRVDHLWRTKHWTCVYASTSFLLILPAQMSCILRRKSLMKHMY